MTFALTDSELGLSEGASEETRQMALVSAYIKMGFMSSLNITFVGGRTTPANAHNESLGKSDPGEPLDLPPHHDGIDDVV